MVQDLVVLATSLAAQLIGADGLSALLALQYSFGERFEVQVFFVVCVLRTRLSLVLHGVCRVVTLHVVLVHQVGREYCVRHLVHVVIEVIVHKFLLEVGELVCGRARFSGLFFFGLVCNNFQLDANMGRVGEEVFGGVDLD